MLVGFVEYCRSLKKKEKERKRKERKQKEFSRSVCAFFTNFLRISGAKLRGELGEAKHQGV